ncbi:MAG: RluA family pseudouridine synthase [Acidobacteriota bacterium]|nr:RluA family pseudouridine synthase [Acidobacteriota bacterium]
MELSTTDQDIGKRLDHFLQEQLPQFSRSRLQEWIKSGLVLVNGRAEKAAHTMRGGEAIKVAPASPAPLHATAEDIPLDILYEDESVIAVNKPAGMVVHAGAGVNSGTLVNALLHRFGPLSSAGGDLRPGIVHRLDRYTSGVILVARNDAAHRHLAAQFSKRSVEKIYLTLVNGVIAKDQGRIAKPIMRDPFHRTRMTARLETGRTALTDFQVLQRYPRFTYLEVKIGTGRTHQIRVHLASIGHPVAGDKLYGAPPSMFGHYFLHAHRISFDSPATEQRVTVTAPLSPALSHWLETGATIEANQNQK